MISKEFASGARVGALMAAYAAEASFGKLRIRGHDKQLRFFTENVGKWCRRCLKAMNVKVVPVGYDPAMFENKNYLLVGNHLSYVDILVLSSVQPSVFVTSVDMGETKFLGPMAELGGSIFVERRSRAHINRDLGVMADTLRAGHNVVIFPEGTSTDGERVHPFKKSLLMSAVAAKKDVLPIVIKYVEIDGKPFSLENRDKICWYGDMGFGPHFMGILKTKSLTAEIHFLEPIHVTESTTRHELAEKAFNQISSVYGFPLGKPDDSKPELKAESGTKL